jgi:hypothetical protein
MLVCSRQDTRGANQPPTHHSTVNAPMTPLASACGYPILRAALPSSERPNRGSVAQWGEGAGDKLPFGAIEERAHGLDVADAARGRQRQQHLPPITFGLDAFVEDGHHAAVVARADQPPDALLEP